MDRAHHGARRIELEGEYDLANRASLASLFETLAPDGPAVIDMTRVTYVDSTALREFFDLRSRLKEHPVTLLGVNEHVRRILRIVDFDSLFEIVEAKA